MIISRTPFRLSFFGGGTDYPAWFREHGGAVLATTINKYCYLTCRYLPPFFGHRLRVVHSKIENVQTVDQISHPAAREILRHMKIERGVEIHHDGDLPARSGTGSSSAFTIGLLHALYALQGVMPDKRRLAVEGITMEQEILKETVGCQDQVMTAYGGFNHVSFAPNGDFAVRPMTLSARRMEELNDHLMLFYTGIARTASTVAQSYVANIEQSKRQLRIIADLVNESMSVLCSGGDLTAFGELLHEAWMVKRSMSAMVSTAAVDDLYAAARSAGAVGGKLTGAGGGGFLLLFVPPDRRAAVRERLSHLIHVPFKFDSLGSQIIFFEPEESYPLTENSNLHPPVLAKETASDDRAGT
ncbi:MAG: kinase [Planctomycetota bacterium]|nr:kinase [Planctomycetota bacterium]